MGGRDFPVVRVSVVTMTLFLVAALLIRSFVRQRMIDRGIDATAAEHLSALFGFAVLGLLAGPVVAPWHRQIISMFRRPRSWPRTLLSGLALGLCLRLASWAGAIMPLAFGWGGLAPPGQGGAPSVWFACPSIAKLALILVVMSLVTPIVEEVLHRGLIFGAMLTKGPTAAVLFSAALFALVHDASTAPVAFFAGMFLAIQYWHFKSLWAPLITHATFNVCAIADSVCLQTAWRPEAVSDSMLAFGAGAVLLAVAAMAGAIWFSAFAPVGANRVGPPRPE